jgi:hypothetical protein
MGLIYKFDPSPADSLALAFQLRTDLQKLLASVPDLPPDEPPLASTIAAWDTFWMSAQHILDAVDADLVVSQSLLRESKIHKSLRRLALLPSPGFGTGESDELTARCLELLRRWKTVVAQADAVADDDSENGDAQNPPRGSFFAGMPGVLAPTTLASAARSQGFPAAFLQRESVRAMGGFAPVSAHERFFSRTIRLEADSERSLALLREAGGTLLGSPSASDDNGGSRSSIEAGVARRARRRLADHVAGSGSRRRETETEAVDCPPGNASGSEERTSDGTTNVGR